MTGTHVADVACADGRGRTADAAVAALAAVLMGAAYLATLAPSVVAGNSGEYQYAVPVLGIVHSTGYPLYTLLGKAFSRLPIGDVAYRMNLLSAVSAAVAVGLLFLVLRRVTPHRAIAAAVALAFGVAQSFWGAALIAEVHTLNVLFVALNLLLLLHWSARQGGQRSIVWRELRLFAFAFGLSLAHHRTVVLLAPAFLAFILWTAWPARSSVRREPGKAARALLLTALVGVLPLALYAYIPLRGAQLLANSDPSVTALYQERVPEAVLRGTVTAHYRGGLEGFVNLVTGRDYSGDVGFESWEQLGERIVVWGRTLIEQFSVVGLLLALIGVPLLWRRDRRLGALFVLGNLSLALFAAMYVGHGQIWYYFIPSYVFLCGFIAAALDGIWRLVEKRLVAHPGVTLTKSGLVLSAVAAVLVVLLPAALARANWVAVDLSRHWIDQERARDALSRPMEAGAVVMGPWDLVTPVRYYQYVEGVRPDLVVIHGDPAQSSGKKIMRQAIALERPFYVLSPARLPAPLADSLKHWVEVSPIPSYSSPTPADREVLTFGGRIDLLGYDVEPPLVFDRLNGGAVSVRLWWRATTSMDTNYVVFIHLIGPDDVARAQVDETPASVYYPTSQWQPGQTFEDVHWLVLPPDAPVGAYRVELGLYDPDTGERLLISSEGDSLSVGPIAVTERSGT